ncbi:heme-binding protein [Mesorhizobium sp. M7A.F.Ca.CA.001.07.2.1]|uniref:GlcG/HbpS family heme-binding protein n=2 Tax=Phyllobacteriaceae TaxID=69277 RepID=UPI000FCAA1D6|nr:MULTISPECIES: heme-binding protein [Mesorhizobium]MCQ8817974.1 heme-binding protein [Mesorhizobium sp. SEMIA396]RVB49531.1 heme-binding protein [Mesorhizobium sp. M7A.F.Ca.CA.004.05.1.1]MCF6125790.1 heme-binding protein [Mesorhizobium ciceri]RUX82020.1 heme-binding protein [Mesorhizobium sp. M7A.F.Ca.CA.004.08.2.1]RUX85611.1 heme-binding protein [Mesorhizobium sp. M7A.F.Ca.CA.004.08.1.1]
MAMFRKTISLTHDGALKAVAAGAARAVTIGVPQCLVVVDASGETIASLRMDGARFLSLHTARAKARTAASINAATGGMAPEAATLAGIASQGGVTNLPGGLPIRFDGRLAGAIGVGSGTGEQDFDVARAALAAIGADAI